VKSRDLCAAQHRQSLQSAQDPELQSDLRGRPRFSMLLISRQDSRQCVRSNERCSKTGRATLDCPARPPAQNSARTAKATVRLREK
jgi:hypothetical protein